MSSKFKYSIRKVNLDLSLPSTWMLFYFILLCDISIEIGFSKMSIKNFILNEFVLVEFHARVEKFDLTKTSEQPFKNLVNLSKISETCNCTSISFWSAVKLSINSSPTTKLDFLSLQSSTSTLHSKLLHRMQRCHVSFLIHYYRKMFLIKMNDKLSLQRWDST